MLNIDYLQLILIFSYLIPLDRRGDLTIFNNYMTYVGQIGDVKLPPNAKLLLLTD